MNWPIYMTKTEAHRESGMVKLEGNHVDEKLEGKWVLYHKNGQIKSGNNYKDGKKDGILP